MFHDSISAITYYTALMIIELQTNVWIRQKRLKQSVEFVQSSNEGSTTVCEIATELIEITLDKCVKLVQCQ